MSKKANGGIFGSQKKKAKAQWQKSTGPDDGEIRIIFIGESADIDFKGPIERFEEIRNHPTAAELTQEDLGNELADYFDNATHKMDLKAFWQSHCNMLGTMTACFLGRHPFFDECKDKANTFVLCGWRKKEGGYFVSPLGACTPEDKDVDMWDIVFDMLKNGLPVLDTMGLDDDSVYHRYAAGVRPVGKELEELAPSSPRLQQVCDAAKTLLPNCRGLSGEEALDWLRENASLEEYQNALKASGEVTILMMPCKSDEERAELLKKAKQLPGKVELGPSLKGQYH